MNAPTLLQRITRLGLILMMGVSMSACSSDQKWKEEVQLSDGRVIVVERELLAEGGGDEWAINRSGVKPKEYRIRFEYPASSGVMIEWRSTKQSPQTWPEIPLRLDIELQHPVIFSDVGNSSGCHIYSKYIYQNNSWLEESLPQQFEKRFTNLFLRLGVGMPSFVNLETKREANSDVGVQAYKQVGPKHPYCR